MRKEYKIGIIIAVVLIAIAAFIIIFYNNLIRNADLGTQVETKLTTTKIEDENQQYNLQMISTLAAEEKTSPMAILIFETKHNSCNHITTDRLEIPKELVNKTEDEIKEKYKDWTIQKFSSNEIVFYQEKEGICDEHYILRENNGYIAIYNIDSFGKETLKEMTQIVTSYLPDTDLIRLKEGIKINGKENLNATIEDYE